MACRIHTRISTSRISATHTSYAYGSSGRVPSRISLRAGAITRTLAFLHVSGLQLVYLMELYDEYPVKTRRRGYRMIQGEEVVEEGCMYQPEKVIW